MNGSTGRHRYLLIDAAIRNFSQWIFIGIKETEVWGEGLWDVTNQYLIEGVKGGLISMILFILIMVKCFNFIGTERSKLSDRQDMQKTVWSLGVILFFYA